MPVDANSPPAEVEVALSVYSSAKRALQLWCRRAAPTSAWAGAAIPLNVIALGFFDTPAATYVLSDPDARTAMSRLAPLRGASPAGLRRR